MNAPFEDRLAAVRALLEQRDWERLHDTLARLRDQDVAHALMELDADETREVFARLAPARCVEVFSYLEPAYQHQLLAQASPADVRRLLSELGPDDLTALLEELPEDEVRRLLRLLPFRAIRRALTLLGHPESSVGRLMSPRYVAVRPDWTLARALEQVRAEGEKAETLNAVFVVDEERHLQGVLPLKRLVLGRPDDTVAAVMTEEPVTVGPQADREHAARLIRHYDLDALPVVDAGGALLGIVTVDDVMDVVEEETTEDFQRIGSVGLFTPSLRDASPALLYRKRIGWLLVLVLVNVLSGLAIARFEHAIAALVVLVFFLPLIIASGGNAGAQSATLMVRALATGDVQARDWLALWGKELAVAVALGVTMGLAVSAVGLWRGGPDLALVVALAMALVVVTGSLIGVLLPFGLARLRLDPATASAPLITSIADIAGILIYFSVAVALLDLPGAA
jgi:magnesium transporter